ncbi:hypothetical protein GCM10007874_69000 [Labrys miyagiensis]|uniref:Uncharacterized protein n=1 Tax=Labrys miyagiensis TaxID=346912 RepID=A0ABQ6CYV6_9HYPH|nr:hypothetical protein GCM10007874_69000 [Labrys miyagiensis]
MTTTAANPRERRPWLDPFMGAKGAPLRALINHVTAAVEAQEQAIGARQRKRRPADQRHHETALWNSPRRLATPGPTTSESS